MYYFNSRNEYHKKPFGAVKEDVTVHFTVISDSENTVPFLCIKKDGGYQTRISMDLSYTDEGYLKFTTQYTFDSQGLYLYCFKFNNGKYGLYHSGRGDAVMSDHGQWFLQTVYSKDFSTPDRFKGGVMYQIFPDRFFESKKKEKLSFSDRNYRKVKRGHPYFNDRDDGKYPINTDYFGGDLNGITEKLDYIKSLGVHCIYLNPIFEAHSNHRYNTADYMKIDPDLGTLEDFRNQIRVDFHIDPDLGTLEDFRNLCKEAHRRDIKIVLDGVFSHTGSDSIYFNREKRYGDGGAFNDKKSPYAPWYFFGDEYKNGYRCWWDFPTLPDVNESNENYIEFICGEKGVIQYWLNNGADGFRLDVADELPDSFIEQVRKAVKKCGNDKLLIGEVWEDAVTKISFGQRRKYLLGKGLDSTMNYPFRVAVLDFIKYGDGSKFCEEIFKIYENYPKEALDNAWNSLSTHDTPRLITYLQGENPEGSDRFWQSTQSVSGEKLKLAKKQLVCAYALTFGLPGVPCVYYGDEIGMQGYRDPFNRGYFTWWDQDNFILNNIRKLSNFRNTHDEYKEGRLHFIYASFNTVAFVRYIDGKEVLTAVNRGTEAENINYKNRQYVIQPLNYMNSEI